MDINMMRFLIIVIILFWSLVVPIKRMYAFGNFLKKVLGVLPISKLVDVIIKSKKISGLN